MHVAVSLAEMFNVGWNMSFTLCALGSVFQLSGMAVLAAGRRRTQT